MDSQTEQAEQPPHQTRLPEHKYPVLSLPNEIVSEIFIQCIPPYPVCPPLRGPSSPTSLTYICRKWRDIALTTPQLWRAITFGDYRTPPVWLERSGSCPLSICWMESNDRETWLPLNPNSLAVLLLHRERWEYVNLTFGNRLKLVLLEGPMALLAELSLRMEFGFDQYGPTHAKACEFPRLRTLSLDSFRVIHMGDWLPWTQLTSLTLANMNPSAYRSALQSAVNLIHLKTIDCNHDDEDRLPDITLPRLETLIMIDSEGYIIQTLGAFIVPSLHTLQLPGSFLDNDPIDAFASFVSKSGCRLRKVLVTGGLWGDSKSAFRLRFPEIPQIAFNSQYEWFARQDGDEDDHSSDSDSESE
ncbi:hypothetical protein FB45DRAFT_905642 [Roridomyces roridus]|uniref:F-box domain-containing protein n=1 Tax=Roridomyces roridus TaxID=1738132 RepID=A0AAD7FUF5_9AGAR|nr:hypothetical protein FB45DRAFT_905642 [Roridomyces roridus]